VAVAVAVAVVAFAGGIMTLSTMYITPFVALMSLTVTDALSTRIMLVVLLTVYGSLNPACVVRFPFPVKLLACTLFLTMWYFKSRFSAVELFSRLARVGLFILAKAAFVGAKTVKLPDRFKVFVRFAFVSKRTNVERLALLTASRVIVRPV